MFHGRAVAAGCALFSAAVLAAVTPSAVRAEPEPLAAVRDAPVVRFPAARPERGALAGLPAARPGRGARVRPAAVRSRHDSTERGGRARQAGRAGLPYNAPPPGMLQALQRDLGLSAEQAQARLLNEIRLAPVEARLRVALGDRFGGSWFQGTVAQNLVVATTDPDDIPKIVAQGAHAEVVEHSLVELGAVKDKLDAALPARPTGGGSVRYVDVRNNKVVVLSEEPVQTEAVIRDIGVDGRTIVVVPSTERPRPLYDLVGGSPFYVGVSLRCTVGFSVLHGGAGGFVSAGHCGKVGEKTNGYNRVPQGVFRGSVFPSSDFSWIQVNDDWTPKPTVGNADGGVLPIAGDRPAIEGASVCRSGSTSDWYCGLILQRDVSVSYPQGNVFGLTRTSVCADRGDSGGPFVSVDQAQGVLSGGSGSCFPGSGFSYFQPVAKILSTYGLTLLTVDGTLRPTTGTCTGYPDSAQSVLPAGQAAYRPVNPRNRARSGYYRSRTAGTHYGCVNSNDGTDVDLYLEKWAAGSGWRTVASSVSPYPFETITYEGTPGYYRYRVVAVAGGGPFLLGYRHP
ncbi:alpha-lytic protease prodomain-containing protein [Streptosporangium sp. NPDC004379]|uniref:alpha-lytic protease prodomain-containing protein n=1 Tax=Streptosporangium sp. NPDC004379 TaxID=3366189 RepID=UPI00369C6D05